MNFIKTKVITEQPKEKVVKKSIKGKLVWGLVSMLIIIYFVFQGIGIVNKVLKTKDEISFAYNKPALVRVLREQYEQKQQELDKSFTIKEKSSQDKLLDAVTDQLQGSK